MTEEELFQARRSYLDEAGVIQSLIWVLEDGGHPFSPLVGTLAARRDECRRRASDILTYMVRDYGVAA